MKVKPQNRLNLRKMCEESKVLGRTFIGVRSIDDEHLNYIFDDCRANLKAYDVDIYTIDEFVVKFLT